jgi:hypothetical protein
MNAFGGQSHTLSTSVSNRSIQRAGTGEIRTHGPIPTASSPAAAFPTLNDR